MTVSGRAAPLHRDAAFGDSSAVDAAHRTIRADSSIQFDFPWEKPDIQPPPRWLTELFEAMGRFVRWVGDGWSVVMWLAVAAIALALIVTLVPPVRDWLKNRLRRRPDPATTPLWSPTTATAHALLDEADRLAAQGNYAQAVRLILHRSIQDIETWRGDPLRPSFTSRDILVFERLPDAARTVFQTIVADVERSLFAGKALDQADWTRARASYADFALGRP